MEGAMEFTFRGKSIYYEIHGEGAPLLLLNGIMMTTASWVPFVPAFTKGGMRLILTDLMDQGKSGAYTEGYHIADQAQMIAALLDHLGHEQCAIMGTSYGGAVALSFATQYPNRVSRLMLAATRCYTDPLFKDMCESWLHACHSPQALYTATMPLFYGASFQEAANDWLLSRRKLLEKTAFSSPDFLARFKRLVESILVFDLRDTLDQVTAPTLVLAPEEDLVMMPWEQKRIAQGIKGAHLVTLHKTGHVMFLEKPDLFIPLMMGWFHFPDTIALP